jgi:putative PIN family toxin of toxin-antitoxin system
MVKRKDRLRVVLDTNVFVRAFKARSPTNHNRRVVRLWLLQRELQLIVSPELIAEYLEIFAKVLGMDGETVDEWRSRFDRDPRSTFLRLGPRSTESRDPDDNVVLSTACAGRARWLITNDYDLLDLDEQYQTNVGFRIATPAQFCRAWDAR